MSENLEALRGHQLGASLAEIDFHCSPQSQVHKGLRKLMAPLRKCQVLAGSNGSSQSHQLKLAWETGHIDFLAKMAISY